MDVNSSKFGVADYVVFSGMLVVSAAVGVYFQFTGGKQRTTEEIILGNKKMSVAPVAFSLMASFASAIGMLGFSAENYLYGFHLAIISVVSITGTLIVIFVYHPVFYNMHVTTVYEYLDRRFGKPTRLLGSIAFMLRMIFYMAVVLYAPALAMSAVTNVSMWACILSVGVVCTFYCTIGGIKAVLWTDLIQGLIMYATLATVIGKGCIDAGGIVNVWKIATEGGRTKMASFSPDLTIRYSFWSMIIGGTFFHLSTNAVTQTQVQRMLTTENIKKSRQAIWASVPLKVIHGVGNCFCGVILYAAFGACDPLLKKEQTGLTSYDQLLPYFIMKSLGHLPGLPGLCIAGLFSAALSTLSSVINSLAAVAMEDFIRPHCCLGTMTESKAAFITKALALAFGVLCILLSYMVDKLGGLMQATITISGVLGGPMLGLFSLGMLFKRPNQTGAISGLIASIAFCMWINFGSRIANVKPDWLPLSVEGCPNMTSTMSNETSTYNHRYLNFTEIHNTSSEYQLSTTPQPESNGYIFPLYRLSFMWYSLIGCLTTVIIGYLVSLFTGPNEDIDPELLSPIVKWSCRKKEKKPKDIGKVQQKRSDSNGNAPAGDTKETSKDKACFVISNQINDRTHEHPKFGGINPSFDDKTITTTL